MYEYVFVGRCIYAYACSCVIVYKLCIFQKLQLYYHRLIVHLKLYNVHIYIHD